MKPSERVEQILEESEQKWASLTKSSDPLLHALFYYLDEEYEKKQKEELADLVQQDIQSNFKSKLI